MKKLNACIAHELHHNVFFLNAKWNFINVSVGKHPMVAEADNLGIPYCAGYAVGYHAAQAYLRRTGI